ncbi:hypothetical protein RHSIM_Rhsim04G0137400 [Rhododendron simsii]|uniref:Uncharacterized protein n=1 Tax=Rhododendron simsii TaxID=118357 RepID=A0A834LRF5_RHOSS|nr:hypothetical protein RHSIM_Rhsim04G0137400 [Rhododendron simsii]
MGDARLFSLYFHQGGDDGIVCAVRTWRRSGLSGRQFWEYFGFGGQEDMPLRRHKRLRHRNPKVHSLVIDSASDYGDMPRSKVDCGGVVCYNMKQYFQHGSINSIFPSNAFDNLRVEMVTQILNDPWSVISESLDAQCGHVEEQSQVPREHSGSAVPASFPADVETRVSNLDVPVNVAEVLSADFGLVENQSQVLDVYDGGSSVNLPGLQCYTLTMKSMPKQQELLKKLVYHFNEQEHEGLEKYKLDLKLASKVRFVRRLVPK